MSLASLLVLLAAAVLHAGWNLLVKQAADKQAFTWWALLAGALLSLPVLAWGFPWPARVWPYALASALCEALYFAALATAYRLADFSLAYPIARGTAPLLLALWSVWWLGEHLRPGGVLGLITPVALFRADRRALLVEGRRHWRRILLTGGLMQISYSLVLFAYARSPVSYAGAIREVSIIFAALAGDFLNSARSSFGLFP